MSLGGLTIQRLTISNRAGGALDRLDLHCPPHEWTSVISPSEGRDGEPATLLLCLTQRLRFSPGTILWHGKPLEQLRRDLLPYAVISDSEKAPNKRLEDLLNKDLARCGAPREEWPQRIRELLALFQLAPRERYGELSAEKRWFFNATRALALEAPLWLIAGCPNELALQTLKSLKPSETTVAAFLLPAIQALSVSDRVAVLHAGRNRQTGPPEQVYRRPVSRTVALATGAVNALPGILRECAAGEALVQSPLGEWRGSIVSEEAEYPPGAPVQLLIRPEAWNLDAYPPEENCLEGSVTRVRYYGSFATYRFSPTRASEPSIELEITTANPRSSRRPAAELRHAWVAPEDVSIVHDTL
ncbi:MAG: hypothetical protein ACFB21_04680 [Opitutales bacterium]